MQLPNCDPLFTKFLRPWYSAEDYERMEFEATRPDILTIGNYAGIPQSELCQISGEGEQEAKTRVDKILDACRGDWPAYLKVFGDIDQHWIEAFDNYYDRKRVANVIARSDPKNYSNDYLILVCEFGAALGHVLQCKEPNLEWVYDSPYWESCLIDRRSGSVIPPFHWAVKKFSEYGLDDGFAAKIDMCVKVLNQKVT